MSGMPQPVEEYQGEDAREIYLRGDVGETIL